MRIEPTRFKAGGLIKDDFHLPPAFSSAPKKWTIPPYIDSKQYFLPTSDQGNTSMCAVYAATAIVELFNWFLDDKYVQLDPHPLYTEAKRTDGLGGGDGTTLDAAAQAVFTLGLLDNNKWRYKHIKHFDEYMHACHKNKVALLGFWIDPSWNECDPRNGYIPDWEGDPIGGHAVVGCGYDTHLPLAFDSGEKLDQYKTEAWIQSSWVPWGHNGTGFARMSLRKWLKQIIGGIVFERKD